jgi:hypothetical protein
MNPILSYWTWVSLKLHRYFVQHKATVNWGQPYITEEGVKSTNHMWHCKYKKNHHNLFVHIGYGQNNVLIIHYWLWGLVTTKIICPGAEIWLVLARCDIFDLLKCSIPGSCVCVCVLCVLGLLCVLCVLFVLCVLYVCVCNNVLCLCVWYLVALYYVP